jgi:glycosyltransferase involved in cell wall biosynthesis
MQVLVDIRHLSDKHHTGVGEYTVEILRALFEMDEENRYELISMSLRAKRSNPLEIASSPTAPRNDKATFTHRSIPSKLTKLTTYFTNRLRLDRLAQTKPDLVWLPNLNFAAISPNVPYVLTIHDLSWKIFPEYFSRKMRLWHWGTRADRLVANASAIIVPSTATKEDVMRFFHKPENQIHVIPHGVNPDFHPDFRTTDHGARGRLKLPKRFALFVGTLEPRKNVVAIVNAVEEYRKQTGDDLHLVLAGSWGWKSTEIRQRVSEISNIQYQISNFVHHLGYVDRTDLPALYRAASVFIWPSVYEGFGLPVLEAMASGTPVITSHTSSLPELTGKAAIHVNPFRPDEIVLALQELMSSPALQDRLRRTGIDRAKQFAWQKSARDTLAVFHSAKT